MFKKKTIFNSDLPEGLSIIDEGGGIHVSPYDTWNSELGYTGIGINSEGHSFVMGIPDNIQNEYNGSDLSINTKKLFSNVLWNPNGINVPIDSYVTNINSAREDFSSKENTNSILAALAASSNPDEIDNAAVVARNYSKGCIGKGQWDLPAGGIFEVTASFSSDIAAILVEQLKVENPSQLNLIYYSVWTSSVSFIDSHNDYYSAYEAMIPMGVTTDYGGMLMEYYVLPVYTIK